jgi:UDP-2,3-diacylglucosamine pyrophosphatase LpxH
MPTIAKKPHSYRTLFISDVHLGSPHAKVDRLYDFLLGCKFEQLYLVGDIFDSLSMVLPVQHRVIWQIILNLLRRGVKVILIPGNHDAELRSLFGLYQDLTILPEAVHITLQGYTIRVVHGDAWDRIGSWAWLHAIDRKLPIPFWELIRRNACRLMVRHIQKFEKKAVASRRGYDKILCGHVHQPAIKGCYLNAGDWVTHCSAIVEHLDGTLELVYG